MTPPTIILRPYQDALVAGARQCIDRGLRSFLLQSPAGSGKTVTAAYMVKGAYERGRSVMFAVHREELARQASRTLRGFGIPHGFVMSSMTMDVRQPVKVAMIDTLRCRLEKVPVPDILFVDEAHHAVSASWAKIIAYYRERGTLVIGLSATPDRLDGKALNTIFQDMVPGPSVKYLIEIGALSDYDYYAPPSLVDVSQVRKKSGGDYNEEDLAAASDRPDIIGDAVEHYKQLLARKRAIGFAVNIRHSKNVAAMYNAAGVPAAHVDGDTDPGERTRIIEAFARGDIYYMSNVSLFGEGFDVPACEGAQFLRKTESLSFHIQCCGRPMRPHDAKDKAILLDHVGNFKHGMPDDDREWTLEGRKKRAGAPKPVGEVEKLSQCPKCYFVHKAAPLCTKCGHQYEVASKTIEVGEGELRKLTKEDKAAIALQRKQEVYKAKTLEDLKQVAQRYGYSEKWAQHVHTARARKVDARAY